MREKPPNQPVFWGLMGVGFVALAAGILMFTFVVPRDLAGEDGLPRDIGLMFTNVFMEQKTFFNESSRYAAAVSQVGVEPVLCSLYLCRLTTPPNGASYFFRLTKDGRTWGINERSPVPKEVL